MSEKLLNYEIAHVIIGKKWNNTDVFWTGSGFPAGWSLGIGKAKLYKSRKLAENVLKNAPQIQMYLNKELSEYLTYKEDIPRDIHVQKIEIKVYEMED